MTADSTDPTTPESDPATPGGPEARPRRRRFPRRISLRGLMLLVLLIGGGLGWEMHRVKVQRDAVAAIEKAGFTVVYRWEWAESEATAPESPWKKWLVDWLGPDHFRYVSNVYSAFGVKPAVDDEIMAQIGRLNRVEVLLLNDVTNLKDEHLIHISGLTQLAVLYIDGSRFEGSGLVHLKRMAHLGTLRLEYIPLDDDDLAHLSGLTSLETLQSENAGAVTDAGLAHLGGLTQLEVLSLRGGSQVTTSGLNSLRLMTQLQDLDLPGARIDSLQPIAQLDNLRDLELERNPLTDEGLKPVAGLSRLVTLSLSQTRITDAGLDHLMGLKSLTLLLLDDTKLSDEGIARLASLPSLNTLRVNRSGLTREGYERFGSMNGGRQIRVKGTYDTGGRLTHFERFLPISPPRSGQAP